MALVLNGSTGIVSPGGDTGAADFTINGLTVGKGAAAISSNTAFGDSTLNNGSTTGAFNTAVGRISMQNLTSGQENSSLGSAVLRQTTTGSYNVGVGNAALNATTTGSNNTALGVNALISNTTASNNTAVGYQAGYNTTTGTDNTFVGWYAGRGITTGTYNTFIGDGAGNAITTGGKNVIIGTYNGNNGGLDIRTASNYIVLSDGDGNPRAYWDNTGHANFASSTNNTVCDFNNAGASPYGISFAYSAAAPNGTGNYFWQGSDTGGLRAKIVSNGGLYNYSANNSNLSDIREKKNIELAGNYLDKVCAIPVKTFLFNDQTDTDLNLGVIAQDVQAIAPELVSETNWGTEEEPKMRLSIYQTDLQYALMKAIQELKAEFDAYKASHP